MSQKDGRLRGMVCRAIAVLSLLLPSAALLSAFGAPAAAQSRPSGEERNTNQAPAPFNPNADQSLPLGLGGNLAQIQQTVSSRADFAYLLSAAAWRWSPLEPHTIFVCWENPQQSFSQQIAAVQKAITDTWQANSSIAFSW